MTETKAVMVGVLAEGVRREAFAEGSRFRGEFYECLTARRDELFELVDAVLCADGPVKSPVDLTLVLEHRRGHGALYGALNRSRINVDRLRALLADMPLPRFEGGRLVLAVDVSPWLRSDAPCSAEAFLVPDAVLSYIHRHHSTHTICSYFLEIDRATMTPDRLADKLRAYARYQSYHPAPTPARSRAGATSAGSGAAWQDR